MTVRRRTLVSLTADCDGDCGQWIAPEDDSGVVLVTEGELADLLDMHGWETVTQFPTRQRFHYCPHCRELLCPRCSRFLGYEAHEPCVFCAVRVGEPWTGAGVMVPMGAHPHTEVLTIPHARLVSTSLEDADTVAMTVAASGELTVPTHTITAEFTMTDPDPDTVRAVFGDPLAVSLPPRKRGWQLLTGWALVGTVCVVVWTAFGLVWLLGLLG